MLYAPGVVSAVAAIVERVRWRLLAGVGHHVLDAGVVPTQGRTSIGPLPWPESCEPPCGKISATSGMWVLIHTQPKSRAADTRRRADVLGPHRRRQAVVHAVGPAEGLLLIGEALYGDDRAEDLLLICRSSWRRPPMTVGSI